MVDLLLEVIGAHGQLVIGSYWCSHYLLLSAARDETIQDTELKTLIYAM